MKDIKKEIELLNKAVESRIINEEEINELVIALKSDSYSETLLDIEYKKAVSDVIYLRKYTSLGQGFSNYQCVFYQVQTTLELNLIKKLSDEIERMESICSPDKAAVDKINMAYHSIKNVLDCRNLSRYQKEMLELYYPIVEIKLRHLNKKATCTITIGEKIKAARLSKNYSMDFLSKSIGMSRSYLHKLEHNNALRPGIEILQKIANVLDMRVIITPDNQLDLISAGAIELESIFNAETIKVNGVILNKLTKEKVIKYIEGIIRN